MVIKSTDLAELVTITAAAAQFERPLRTVQSWCDRGWLPCTYVQGRRLIRQTDIDAFELPRMGRKPRSQENAR